ncbi:MAG: FAD-dependent oxidoreductase, partial [Candidatus Omnitrophica bacterium]|nr:FAD-dependent oxidoreductase [Candidatus Omnitrophota bacterium]
MYSFRLLLCAFLSILFLNPSHALEGNKNHNFDIVIVGGTPGGIAAAISAGRLGSRVALVERFDHIGGMTTSGLGKSDIEHREMIQGLFKEFVEGVRQHYLTTYGENSGEYELCKDGYYYEPSVAEKVFMEMVEEVDPIDLFTGYRLISVSTEDNAPKSIVIEDIFSGERKELGGRIFIDATYEGDLFAMAGADFRLGREGREVFGEPHAGVFYYDFRNKKVLPGSTGEGDDRLPAYTYRLCLATDPENSVPVEEPPGYNREDYVGYFEDLEAGRLSAPKNFKPGRGYFPEHFDKLVRALSVTLIPNDKTDVNMNPRPLAFPFAEENEGYIEGDWETRLAIEERLRNLTLGLLYFLQNDPEIPKEHREIASEYQLPKDEFIDNDHFPHQLYIREGRRLKGVKTLTELDVTLDEKGENPPYPEDSIAIGEFPIDSFPVRKKQPGDDAVLEGYLSMMDSITAKYGIP